MNLQDARAIMEQGACGFTLSDGSYVQRYGVDYIVHIAGDTVDTICESLDDVMSHVMRHMPSDARVKVIRLLP